MCASLVVPPPQPDDRALPSRQQAEGAREGGGQHVDPCVDLYDTSPWLLLSCCMGLCSGHGDMMHFSSLVPETHDGFPSTGSDTIFSESASPPTFNAVQAYTREPFLNFQQAPQAS